MVRVNVHERGVKTNRALVQGDQHSDIESIDAIDCECDRFTPVLPECLAGSKVEAAEIICGSNARFYLDRPAFPPSQDFDKRDEKIVHAVTQLLNVRVLVGRTLVPVNSDSLVYHVPVQIPLFPDRFHDQLLEVLRKKFEAVLIREDHHVLFSFAVG